MGIGNFDLMTLARKFVFGVGSAGLVINTTVFLPQGHHTMDITQIFRNCITTNQTRKKACGISVPDRIRTAPKQPGPFAVRARGLVRQAAKLGAFIAETRAAYSNFSGLSGLPQISDAERDRIDLVIPREANKLLSELKTSVDVNELNPQHHEHQTAVLKLIRDYLRRIIAEHGELRFKRLERAQEAKRNFRLDAHVRSDDEQTPRVVIPSWTPMEEEESVTNLSTEELQIFEEENEQLHAQFTGLLSEMHQLEQNVTEVAHLQEQFTEKIVEQDRDIERVYGVVVGSTENIKDANEQLRQAIQRNAGLRVYVLFFLLVMSFSLLFLDWYKG